MICFKLSFWLLHTGRRQAEARSRAQTACAQKAREHVKHVAYVGCDGCTSRLSIGSNHNSRIPPSFLRETNTSPSLFLSMHVLSLAGMGVH